ncbi:bestrophin-like domain [Devosia sp. SL43]|uniref:bestrophin-like domain n=1 Tax=Devosia sp. SL43 TaxID=2806348 RepID=UPI001F3C0050|nr:DUF4239 domain-containing protein [Devosia sp. SL43]UJW87376.1 DUF4239 domain-containing protein [Devosia sp. SL43]
MGHLYDIFVGTIFIAGTVALSLAVYLTARWFTRKAPPDRHPEMAGAMVMRIGALHGLILALVFAQEMAGYQRLETHTATEASAIADVYNDAARYDPVALMPLQQTMVSYTREIIESEWPSLGRDEGLSAEAWLQWERAYAMALDLEPANARQTSLRDHMIAQLHAIATARNLRDADGSGSVFVLFWFAALSGVVLIALGYYSHRPEPHNLVLMSLFSAYTGVILFLIYGFSNPYAAPAALSPAPMERLYEQISAPSQ